jgi:hypothetical protein
VFCVVLILHLHVIFTFLCVYFFRALLCCDDLTNLTIKINPKYLFVKGQSLFSQKKNLFLVGYWSFWRHTHGHTHILNGFLVVTLSQE